MTESAQTGTLCAGRPSAAVVCLAPEPSAAAPLPAHRDRSPGTFPAVTHSAGKGDGGSVKRVLDGCHGFALTHHTVASPIERRAVCGARPASTLSLSTLTVGIDCPACLAWIEQRGGRG